MNEDRRKKLLQRKSKGFVQKLNKIGLTEQKQTEKQTRKKWNAQNVIEMHRSEKRKREWG